MDENEEDGIRKEKNKQRKRSKMTIEKFKKINEILSEFDNLQPDMQISSLCSTLERLGSL